jgi:hypothetical protein
LVSSSASLSSSTSQHLFATMRVNFTGGVIASVRGERTGGGEAGNRARGPVAATATAWSRLQQRRLAAGAIPAIDSVGRLQEM